MRALLLLAPLLLAGCGLQPLYSAGGKGSVAETLADVRVAPIEGQAGWLVRNALRMRPDRLLVGELRGAETVTFLRAINTGHPGSLSTIHASSVDGAFEQIALMCMQAGLGLTRSETVDYARSMVDVVVQMTRAAGRREISEVRLLS